MRSTPENEAETTNCYVYCFCSAPAPDVSSVTGLEDTNVFAIEYEDVVAIAANCSRRPQPSVPNVVAHNRVVDSILETTTPVPCRFGTTLRRRDLDLYLKARGDAIKTLLRSFEGCVEMTLRIVFTAEFPVGPFEDATRALRDQLLPEPRGPGARFLEEKIREAKRQGLASQHMRTVLDWADSRFGVLVTNRATRLSPENISVAEVAHLVARNRLQQYRGLLASAQSDRRDLRLSISGPWAPYSFAILDNRRGQGNAVDAEADELVFERD
jgi:hypothetical protein